jgi:hypothetical protein
MDNDNEYPIGKLTIYHAKWCGNCKSVLPPLLSMAGKVGVKIDLIDVDNVATKSMCAHVKWVPYIEQNGSEISVEELLHLLLELSEKED